MARGDVTEASMVNRPGWAPDEVGLSEISWTGDALCAAELPTAARIAEAVSAAQGSSTRPAEKPPCSAASVATWTLRRSSHQSKQGKLQQSAA